MLLAIKLLPAPFLAAVWFLASASATLKESLDLAALGMVIGGVFVIARYRSSGEAQERAITALEGELEATRARAERFEQQIAEKDSAWIAFSEEQRELRHSLKDQLAEASAKTDLTGLTRLVVENNKDLASKIVDRGDLNKLVEEVVRLTAAIGGTSEAISDAAAAATEGVG